LKRAIRHTVDPRTPDIRYSTSQTIEVQGEIGLLVHTQVKATMRNATYDVKVAFTKNNLVACSCTCQAGSMGEERIVCVHILPILFQLTQLTYFGMGQHILIEISNATQQMTYNNNEEK
jgi:hypothetical protein